MLPIWVKSMETLKISKADCRKKILETRKSLRTEDRERWDGEIMKRLLSIPAISGLAPVISGLNPASGISGSGKRTDKNTDTVYCYIGVRGETGTEALIRHFLGLSLRVAVPRVKGKDMSFYYINSYDDLEPGGFGIPEPVSSCELAACKEAPVIVPGVAFSRRYERTGYGAGYYDRFFAAEPEHEKIAVCYDFQLFEGIASDSFDVPMDYIVTSTEFLCREEKNNA